MMLSNEKVHANNSKNRKWNPSVSIIMCTYNGAKYLKQQMDSIVAQTYLIREILIFDDASKDDTVEVLKTYAAENPIIKIQVNNVNLGFNKNFKQAIQKADADLIGIADQDDVWHHEKIEKMVNHWVEDTPVMYCDSVRFSDTLPEYSEIDPFYKRFSGTDSRRLGIFNTMSGHAMLIKSSFLPLATDFTDAVVYDWWIGMVAACNGGVSYIPETLVYQRIHGNNASIGNGFDYNTKEEKAAYKAMINRHLQQFATMHNMPASQKAFFGKMAVLWAANLGGGFSPRLALFLFLHRKIVFPYKSQKNTMMEHLKHCIMLANN